MIDLQRWSANKSLFRWHIVTSELRRFWQFYIGLPVSPRSWAFNVDRVVDEL